jgi:hypothetical protein
MSDSDLVTLKLETRESFHGLNMRLSRLEWQDTQFANDGVEWRKQIQDQLSELATRIKVFEDHKTKIAWYGWSLVVLMLLGALKIWAPILKGIL